MKKYKVIFLQTYEVEAENKDDAENEGYRCLQDSMDNGEIFSKEIKEIKIKKETK